MADLESFQHALAHWSALLGDQHVATGGDVLDRYARSSTGQSSRPAAVLFPTCTDHVQSIVQTAHKYHVPVHPISCGKNWGYTDASPPGERQVVIDLTRMNRILEVNSELAYAVIEPGVTQQQLWQYLNTLHPNLWMDSTGAGLNASLVGNTLDRGFGHTRLGDHYLNTCGMQIVLPDGRILETGYGHYENAKAHRVYRYGVGPMLDGLFAQSNLGVVTRIGIWLNPKPQDFCAFFFLAPRDEDLADVIDRLRPLRMQGLLQSAIHVANDLRTFSARTRYPWDMTRGVMPLPSDVRAKLRKKFGVGAWNGAGAIYGSKGSVAAIKDDLREALSPYRVKFLDDRKLAAAQRVQRMLAAVGLGQNLGELLQLVKPVYGLLKGEPSNEHLGGTLWRVRGESEVKTSDPLQSHAGVMWVSPVLPTMGSNAHELMRLIEPIYLEHGFEPLVTFTLINERAMVCVTNLAFDTRETEEVAKAQRCYDQLVMTLIERGYIPYRTGNRGFEKLHEQPSVFWDVTKQIKATLDPHQIISPGRYIPR